MSKFVSDLKANGGSLYRRLKLNYTVPFVFLLLYTVLGAAVFYLAERNIDVSRREKFKHSYEYAYSQITERLVEIKWEEWISLQNNSHMIRNKTEAAVVWFCDYLNITEFLNDRMASSAWSWSGSMFYAGTLYTTIGKNHPNGTIFRRFFVRKSLKFKCEPQEGFL